MTRYDDWVVTGDRRYNVSTDSGFIRLYIQSALANVNISVDLGLPISKEKMLEAFKALVKELDK